MYSFIRFVGTIIDRIVNILNIRFFSDIKLSLLDIILGAILIKVIIKFISGGYKEFDSYFSISKIGRPSKMKHEQREKQIVNNVDTYVPKHSKKSYIPKHGKVD